MVDISEEVLGGAEEQASAKKDCAYFYQINSLLSQVYERDRNILEHSNRVALIAREIAILMGFCNQSVEQIYFSGLLHDVGKIEIPNKILQKNEKLTPLEYKIVKRHTELGYRMLESKGNEFLLVALYARHHHERWDGKGYPLKLKGEQIPVGSTILALADAFEAMTSNRVYRNAMSEEMAIREIEANIGKQFSPKVARIFLENFAHINRKR